jgi:ABC-type transporter Mla MlaB component
MLKVTPDGRNELSDHFRLEGRLVGPYVAELSRALQPSLLGSRRVVLDLHGVTFVDTEGAILLKELVSRNIEMHGYSGFIAQLVGLS